MCVQSSFSLLFLGLKRKIIYVFTITVGYCRFSGFYRHFSKQKLCKYDQQHPKKILFRLMHTNNNAHSHLTHSTFSAQQPFFVIFILLKATLFLNIKLEWLFRCKENETKKANKKKMDKRGMELWFYYNKKKNVPNVLPQVVTIACRSEKCFVFSFFLYSLSHSPSLSVFLSFWAISKSSICFWMQKAIDLGAFVTYMWLALTP